MTHDKGHVDAEESMIADSGCKRSVAGKKWHKQMRKTLANLGLKPVMREIKERFRFGDGKVLTARRRGRTLPGCSDRAARSTWPR